MTSANPVFDDSQLAQAYAGPLNGIAARAIRHGLDHGPDHAQPMHPADGGDPPALRVARATFITLEYDGALRGCVGGLEAHRSLAADVAAHAVAAAFYDTRFDPVDAQAWPRLTVSISILSPREPLAAASEADARAALRPHVDGIVLSDGPRRGVFLPKVWEEAPDPALFLTLLKRKAGLAETHWSPTVKLERFTTATVPSCRLAAALGEAF